jgi:hypothetical protein
MKKAVKRTCLMLMFLLTAAAAAGENPDTSVYIKGLESFAADDFDLAKSRFEQLLESYPESPYAEAAARYLAGSLSRPDTGGIVTFYAGNLATAVYTAVRLPELLDYELDTVLFGVTGLAGVTAGLGSAWLMAKDYPVSSSTDWWIESTQLTALGNYIYLSRIIDPVARWGYPAGYKANLAGQLTTLLGSRAGAYFGFRENPPPKGQGSFMLHSYAWANLYYQLIVKGIFEYETRPAVDIGALIATDLAAAGSLRLWEGLQWSPLRTGLVTVGGLGGGLVGFFSVMILDELTSLDSRINVGLVTALAMAGKVTAAVLTRTMEDDNSTYGRNGDLFFLPSVFPGGEPVISAGIRLKL